MFGQRLLDPHSAPERVGAFVIFCALSGVVYLINDVADREADRRHPVKMHRADRVGRAAGAGGARARRWSSARRRSAAAFLLRPLFGVAGGGRTSALLALYSGPLKHIVILDVLTIAIGFVLRAVAGGVAIDVPISHWLLRAARCCWRCSSR